VKGGSVSLGDKYGEGFADKTLFIYIQQGGGGLVGILNYSGCGGDEIAVWGEFKEFLILSAFVFCGLMRCCNFLIPFLDFFDSDL